MNPAVRLAYHPEGGRTLKELGGPAVRLALGMNPNKVAQDAIGPVVRLATAPPGSQGSTFLQGMREGNPLDGLDRPALLISYVYLAPFLKNRHRYHYRDWALDSGAYSAHNSGTEIRLQAYIDCCKRLKVEDPTLSEIFALDVIGDWRASLKNTEEMWRQGVEAIPCFHANEPESVLLGLAKDYPKIALGGVALAKLGLKMQWAGQCFARVWPKKIHGFAFCSQTAVMGLPFHSVDATNWELGPCKFGRWQSFGQMSVRGSKQNLRAEVEWYLKLERIARQRWAREMAQLDPTALNPSVRLAVDASSGCGLRVEGAVGKGRVDA